jgi:hypothetical protein
MDPSLKIMDRPLVFEMSIDAIANVEKGGKISVEQRFAHEVIASSARV